MSEEDNIRIKNIMLMEPKHLEYNRRIVQRQLELITEKMDQEMEDKIGKFKAIAMKKIEELQLRNQDRWKKESRDD